MLLDFNIFLSTLWETWIQHREWLFGVIILCFILYILRRHRSNTLVIKTSSNELGELFVTKSAILKLIENISIENQVIHIKKIKLANKKHLFRIKTYVHLSPEQSFDIVSLQLQEHMQQTIIKYCGMTKHVRVDIILDGLIKQKQTEK